MEKDFKKANDELNELNTREKKVNETLNKNRVKFSEAQSSFASNRNRNKVLSFLMQLKNEGNLDGLFGRLVGILNLSKVRVLY